MGFFYTIKNLNLSSSEVTRFENINKNLSAELAAMDFDGLYEALNDLKLKSDLIKNETARRELNNKINILEQEIVELENHVMRIDAIAES